MVPCRLDLEMEGCHIVEQPDVHEVVRIGAGLGAVPGRRRGCLTAVRYRRQPTHLRHSRAKCDFRKADTWTTQVAEIDGARSSATVICGFGAEL